jgi:hypothetical protein
MLCWFEVLLAAIKKPPSGGFFIAVDEISRLNIETAERNAPTPGQHDSVLVGSVVDQSEQLGQARKLKGN